MSIAYPILLFLLLSLVAGVSLSVNASRSKEIFALTTERNKNKEEIRSLQQKLRETESKYSTITEAVRMEAKGLLPHTGTPIPPKPAEPPYYLQHLQAPGASCSCANGSGYGCTGHPETCINYEEDRYEYEENMQQYQERLKEWEALYSDEMVRLQALKKELDACRGTRLS